MTVSTRQFNHLKEMDIALWQRKSFVNSVVTELETANKNITSDLSIGDVVNQQIFQDILRAFSLKTVDISWQKSHIDLGVFNWEFIDDDHVSFDKNTLTTPTIAIIGQSSVLKKQLWQTIIQHNLIS